MQFSSFFVAAISFILNPTSLVQPVPLPRLLPAVASAASWTPDSFFRGGYRASPWTPDSFFRGGYRASALVSRGGFRATSWQPELPHIAPKNASVEEKYAYYAKLVRRHGGSLSEARATVLALRGISPQGLRHSSCDNASDYDDTLVVLRRLRGRAQVVELLGSTHAGQKSSAWVSGVAQIRPGNYVAEPAGEHEGMPCWSIKTRDGSEDIPCWRDLDQDGVISAQEKALAEQHHETADGILFHNGRFDDHGGSIGCQTMKPAIYQRFAHTVGVKNSLDYTLINANRD